MGLLLLFLGLTIFGALLPKFTNKSKNLSFEAKSNLSFGGGVLSVLCGIAVFVMFIMSRTLPSDFAYIEGRYKNLKNQIQFVKFDGIVTAENLRNQVLEMNNTIEEHKCYSKNAWIGMWYSKRIGNLEPLQWEYSVENKE